MERRGIIRRAKRLCIFVAMALACCLAGVPASAQSGDDLFARPLEVRSGQPAGDAIPHIRYLRGIEGEVSNELLRSTELRSAMQEATSNNYGAPGTRILATLAVKNVSEQPGSWLLTTRRASFRELRIGEWHDGELRWLVNRHDPDIGKTLRAYNGVAHTYSLAPGQSRRFVVTFEGAYSSILPLAVADADTAAATQKLLVALVAGSVFGMLVLIIASILLYAVSGRRDFLWLGFAEAVHAVFVLHVTGYTTFYFLHDKGVWLYTAGLVIPALYGASMGQFARKLLRTSQTSPGFDRFLRLLIAAALITIFGNVLEALTGTAYLTNWVNGLNLLVILTYQLVFPLVAWVAVKRSGRIYAPLLAAWGLTSLMTAFGLIVSRDVIPGLTFDWHLYSPVGLFSSLCLTLTTALHVRRIFHDKQKSETALVQTLKDKLQLSEKALRLQEDRATAWATIEDQTRLLHASGHDSRQVLMALKSVSKFVDETADPSIPPELPEILRASAVQLDEVISTTMAGPLSGGLAGSLHAGPVALSRFALRELLGQLTMIYQPLARQKGLTFETVDAHELMMVSDRALLARILSNFLSNAVKFSGHGTVQLNAATNGDLVELTIADQGCGMERDLISKLLDKSDQRVRGDVAIEGTGFGFKASEALVRKIHGKLRVESKPNAGTELIISLPLVSMAGQISEPDFKELAEKNDIKIYRKHNGDSIEEVAHDKSFLLAGNRVEYACGDAPVILLDPPTPDMLRHPLLNGSAEAGLFKGRPVPA